jgi:two-component system, response regulator YesN
MKILIVDDEIMIRVGLKSAVPWEENGFQIVGDASNGEEALKIFKDKLPDIVLTDIKMPVMDGLQLIEKIREIDKSVKIIILSCHNEFEFVKKALRLGAEDYLLKAEFNEKELLDKIIKLRNDLLQTQEEKRLIRDVRYLNTNSNRNKLISELFWGVKVDKKDNIERLKVMGVNINFNSYACIVVKVEDKDVVSTKWEDNKDGLFSSALINILEEIMNSYKSGSVFESIDDFIIILNLWDKSELKLHESIIEICEKIKSSVLMYLNIRITLGVSSVHYGVDNMKKAFSEAQSVMDRRFFMGKGSTIFYNSQSNSAHSHKEEPGEVVLRDRQLLNAVESLDKKLVEELLYEYFAQLSNYKGAGIETVYDKVTEFLYLFKKTINHLGYDINELLNEKFNPIQLVQSKYTFDELAEEVRRVVLNTIDAAAKKHSGVVCRPVQRAIEYINEHYNENISLLVVAEYLGLNMSYLSNLFKSEMGENFTDYLTRFRISNAKRLILMKKYKIYEIAQMVGYPNEAYFSTIFKKAMGVNPKDYDGER